MDGWMDGGREGGWAGLRVREEMIEREMPSECVRMQEVRKRGVGS
jgi:hypothetical protein